MLNVFLTILGMIGIVLLSIILVVSVFFLSLLIFKIVSVVTGVKNWTDDIMENLRK